MTPQPSIGSTLDHERGIALVLSLFLMMALSVVASSLMFLSINPPNGNPVSLHPLLHVGVCLQLHHHASFHIALEPFEAVRAFRGLPKLAVFTDCHVR